MLPRFRSFAPALVVLSFVGTSSLVSIAYSAPAFAAPTLNTDDTYYAWTFEPAAKNWRRLTLPAVLRDGKRNPNFESSIVLRDGRVLLGQSTIYDPRAPKNAWTDIGEEAYLDFAGVPTAKGAFGFGTDTGPEPGVPFVFESATNRWRRIAAPIPHAHAAPFLVTMADGRILVVGRIPDENYAYRELDFFDPGTETWTTSTARLDGLSFPSAVIGLADGRVALVLSSGGGKDGACSSSVLLYDPKTDSLSPLPATAHARCFPNLVELDGGKLVVSGGMKNPSDFDGLAEPSAEIFSLGAKSTKWELLEDPSFGRAFGLGIPFGKNQILYEGGMTVTLERTVPDLLVYDFSARRPSKIVSGWPKFKLGYASAAKLADGRILFFSRFLYSELQ